MDIVLVEPEIPQNTGSIARTCAATKSSLHLIGKLGFEITEKAVRRAGLDYWPFVDLQQHSTWEEYLKARDPKNIWLLSKFADRPYFSVNFTPADALVFGSETKGLSLELKQQYSNSLLKIPMDEPGVRSLNLSNSVSIVLFEARRQFTVAQAS